MCGQADEAEATYKTCIADATTQQLELEHTKVTVLRQLQDVIKQSDQTLRSVRTHTHTHTQTCRRPYCKGSKHKLIHDTLCCITSSIRQPSHTTSSCTCRRWPCRSTTRLCVRAVSCMIQDSSTPPTCETCSYQSSRMFTTHLRATVPPVHRHSKSFSQSDYYLGFESKP